jgi:hypothetical protein
LFQESVWNNPDENNRLRICNLNYYMEDDTLEVFEPKKDDAAMPQASPHRPLVKRIINMTILLFDLENL